MSNPNPLIPQGSLLDQQAKSKPHLRIALCIVAVHLIFLGGLLMQGCKREPAADARDTLFTNDYALSSPLETNLYAPTNLAASLSNEPSSMASLPPYTNPAPLAETLPSATAAQEYTVAKGDSFYSIGKKLGVSSIAIAKANPGVDSSRLKVGQKLQIPSAPAAPSATPGTFGQGTAAATDVYVVKAGDTLTKIAKAHGITIGALRDLNGLRTDRIQVGQKLKIPAPNTPAEPTTPSPGTFPGTNPRPSPVPLTSSPITQ